MFAKIVNHMNDNDGELPAMLLATPERIKKTNMSILDNSALIIHNNNNSSGSNENNMLLLMTPDKNNNSNNEKSPSVQYSPFNFRNSNQEISVSLTPNQRGVKIYFVFLFFCLFFFIFKFCLSLYKRPCSERERGKEMQWRAIF